MPTYRGSLGGAGAEPAGGQAAQDTGPSGGGPYSKGKSVGETVILLHPPLPLAGVLIAMERERQQRITAPACPGHERGRDLT